MHGAALPDPVGLSNSSLDGSTRRAIDFHETDTIDAAAFVDEGSLIMEYRIEVIVLPIADVARGKEFHERAGFVCDTDHQPNDEFRVVQLTPPGSACSIIVGKGIGQGEPGSVQGTYLVLEDLPAAIEDLAGRGVEVSEPFHFGPSGQEAGLDPNRAPFGSMAPFADPDGNTWLLQEIPTGGHVR